METDAAFRHARLLRIVAHPTRLMILDELARGMRCVNDIGEILDVPQPNVSQHLAMLRDSGLVTCHRDGVTRCYRLARPGLVRDLFAVLGRGYPAAEAGEPQRCRAARNAPRRKRSARRMRATERV